MFQEHCRDEHLVSAIFGELRPFSRFRWHLKICASCRRRMRLLQDEFLHPPLAWGEADPVDPIAAEQARVRFLAWAQTADLPFEAGRPWLRRIFSPVRIPAMTVACALVLAGGIGIWQEFSYPTQQLPPVPSHPRAGALRRPFTLARNSRAAEPLPTLAPAPEMVLKPPDGITLPPPQSEELAVEAWSILHRAGACEGEPIEAIPMAEAGRGLVIRGVVSSRARKQQLARIFLAAPNHEWMRLELETPEDLAGRAVSAPPAETHTQTAVTVTRNVEFEHAVAAILKSMYSGEPPDELRRRLADLGSAAVREVERASSEVWALERLRRRFPPQIQDGLSLRTRQAIEAMARDHVAGLRLHLEALTTVMGPTLSKLATEPPAPADPDLFVRIERLRVLVESGMAGAAQHQDEPPLMAGEILALASHAAVELDNPGDVVHRFFAVNVYEAQGKR